jgi:hypothetical protein
MAATLLSTETMTPNTNFPANESSNSDKDNETSPESAALARGAAASAKHGARTTAVSVTKGSVGRLPATASKASKLPSITARTSTPPLPKSIPRARGAVKPSSAARTAKVTRVKVKGTPRSNQSIAKATDRFSTGMDVWNAATEGGETESRVTDSKKQTKWTLPSLGQVAAFTRTFVTNTLMGMAVFSTYEGTVGYFAASDNGACRDREHITPDPNEQDSTIKSTETDGYDLAQNERYLREERNTYQEDANSDRVSIPIHFFAGGLGGAAHAALALGLEIKLNVANQSGGLSSNNGSTKTLNFPLSSQFSEVWNSIKQRTSSVSPSNGKSSHLFLTLQHPVMNYSIATTGHHVLAHSVLFGSYQSSKWFLSEYTATLKEEKFNSFISFNLDSSNMETIAHSSVIAVAGGLAGQAQHIISHFTEQWFGMTTTHTTEMKQMNFKSPLYKRIKQSSWPSFRSTMLAFPPSAVGFLAFEYGKLMV